jgi:hypothetical protein
MPHVVSKNYTKCGNTPGLSRISRPFLRESPSSAIWLRGFGDWDQIIDPGFSGRIEAAVFCEPRKQAFAGFPLAFNFGLNNRQSEFGKMQLQRFQHAHQNRATLRPREVFSWCGRFCGPERPSEEIVRLRCWYFPLPDAEQK